MTSAAPNAAKTIVSGRAPRRRSRRNTSTSMAHAASPVKTAAISAAPSSGQPNESGPVGAPREQLGMREVREAHDSEREGHADRAECDDGAGEDAVGQRLGDH